MIMLRGKILKTEYEVVFLAFFTHGHKTCNLDLRNTQFVNDKKTLKRI